ncbi:hypothetical protein [Clostridium akagii]|uniref:hypothetical protein n=1 Tax=Clostridium akagii TaxID=91623 RepID=UPI000478E385|nr:hypothetical protein [Clostridium akagii]
MDKLENIIKMTEEELIERHDKETKGFSISGDFYLKEYYRRQQEKSDSKMMKYTKWMTIMAFIVMIATIVNVVVFIYRK